MKTKTRIRKKGSHGGLVINGWTFDIALIGLDKTSEVMDAVKKGLEDAGAKHVTLMNRLYDVDSSGNIIGAIDKSDKKYYTKRRPQ